MIMLHVTLNYILVFAFNWGVAGLALASVLGRVIALLALLFNAYLKREHLEWSGFDCYAIFSRWKEPISLGISGN